MIILPYPHNYVVIVIKIKKKHIGLIAKFQILIWKNIMISSITSFKKFGKHNFFLISQMSNIEWSIVISVFPLWGIICIYDSNYCVLWIKMWQQGFFSKYKRIISINANIAFEIIAGSLKSPDVIFYAEVLSWIRFWRSEKWKFMKKLKVNFSVFNKWMNLFQIEDEPHFNFEAIIEL